MTGKLAFRARVCLLLAILAMGIAPIGGPAPLGLGTRRALAAPAPAEVAIGLTALPVSLDPVQDNGLTALATYSLLYDRLIDIDDRGNERPSVATSWRAVNDRTWEFKIRTGVRFHNGEPLDAAAVKFAIDRALTAPQSRFRTTLGPISRVNTPDATTVIVETSEPFAFLPSRLGTRVWFYPPRYFQERDVAGFTAAPVGSGRFRFVSWQRDNFVLLDRHDTYWGGAVQIARIRLRHMPDYNSRLTALEARELHLGYIMDVDDAERLERGGFRTVVQPIGQGFQYFFRTTIASPLRDVRVRRAFNHAVNKDLMARVFFAGKTRVLQGQPVGPDAQGFDADIKPYAFDQHRARQLLAEAGHPNGFTLPMDIGIGFAPRAKEVAEMIAGDLRTIGVRAQIQENERGVYLDKLVNARMAPMWELSLNYAPSFDLLPVLNNFICDTLHKSHCDPQFDALYRRWVGSFNEADQKRLGNQALRYVSQQALALFLWQIPGIYVTSPNLQGVRFRGDYTMDLTQATVR
jgi:peptide/nickel transport system substrate-binding protein